MSETIPIANYTITDAIIHMQCYLIPMIVFFNSSCVEEDALSYILILTFHSFCPVLSMRFTSVDYYLYFPTQRCNFHSAGNTVARSP